tara:strand:+ start:1229 stop:2125 length:897 start_codon:yes stop_codon:yes gene_type:complete
MISIIIPAYNHQTINNAILSIFKQSIDNLEIIIIDDSPNNEIQKNICALDHPKIQYYKNVHNIGTTRSRIRGIKKSQGSYIGFLDDDDIMLNNGIEKQAVQLDKKNLDFVFCDYTVNNVVNELVINKNISSYEKNFTKSILCSPGPFLQCCLFQKKFMLKHIDYLNRFAEPSEDWNFFIHISQHNLKIKHIPIVSFQWNLTKNSQSINYEKEALALEYIINQHYSYMKKNSKKNLSLQHRKLGSMFYYIGQYKKSQKLFKKSFLLYPVSIKNIIIILTHQCPMAMYHWFMKMYVKKII